MAEPGLGEGEEYVLATAEPQVSDEQELAWRELMFLNTGCNQHDAAELAKRADVDWRVFRQRVENGADPHLLARCYL